VAGRWEGSVVQARVWCVLEAGSLAEHVAGSDEGEDKHSRRYRAPIVGVARTRVLENGENPENLPEQEILGNGENSEICKVRNNKQKCSKPELPKDPAKRQESQKNNIREQNHARKSKSRTKPKQKICEEARDLD